MQKVSIENYLKKKRKQRENMEEIDITIYTCKENKERLKKI